MLLFLLQYGATLDCGNQHFIKIMESDDIQESSLCCKLIKYIAIHQDMVINFDLKNLGYHMKIFYENCRNQIFMMKNKKVYGYVTYYNLLVNKDLLPFVRNEIILNKMTSNKNCKILKAEFPNFFNTMYDRFKNERKNYELRKRSNMGLAHILRLNENSFITIFNVLQKFLNHDDRINLASM